MSEQPRKPILRRAWVWVVIVVLGIGLFAAVVRPRGGPGGKVAVAEKKVLYQCPMHPNYTSDRPGECPICGMNLVPVKAEKKQEKPLPGLPGLATVTLTPEKIQLIGVRVGQVMRMPAERTIRTVGTVKADETRLSNVNTKVAGWVQDLLVDYEGASIRKGQPMLTIYSPDLVSTQEEYLLALRSRTRLQGSPFPEIASGGERLVEATRQRLLLWDIPPAEIARVEKTGQPRKTMTLYSPASGVVVKKAVFSGMQIAPGTSLYEVADLSHVWVEADIYEYEIAAVKVGQPVTLTINAFPGRQWKGRILFIYPYLENQTRTVKVRFDVPNPGLMLKPGMFANAEMKIPLGEQLVVPFEAVTDTGERKIVYVDRGEGRYQPTEVQLGDKVDDSYVVLKGLQAGEAVVTSGNFLLDSEARLSYSQKSMGGMPGMSPAPSKSTAPSTPAKPSTSMPGMPGM